MLEDALAPKAWNSLTWAEKKEIAKHIRPIIRSSLRKLDSEYDPGVTTIPNWLNEAFHQDFARVTALGGRPTLIRPGHICKVVDTRPQVADDTVRVIPLTSAEWLNRAVPPQDELMGAMFTTTSRSILSADTGLGKSLLMLAIETAMAHGCNFLHWRCRRPGRVLFIDGEMSVGWLKQMNADAVRRHGGTAPDNLHLLSREDYPGMPPLNTKEGYAFIRGYIEVHGHYDFITFDNIMSLTVGNPKDPEAWQAMQDLIAHLTRIRTGQLWVNHTGHDATRAYGDKTREWRMTSVLHMDKTERAGTDTAFELKFVKCRERTQTTVTTFRRCKSHSSTTSGRAAP